jgi:hypothetical protein
VPFFGPSRMSRKTGRKQQLTAARTQRTRSKRKAGLFPLISLGGNSAA